MESQQDHHKDNVPCETGRFPVPANHRLLIGKWLAEENGAPVQVEPAAERSKDHVPETMLSLV